MTNLGIKSFMPSPEGVNDYGRSQSRVWAALIPDTDLHVTMRL
jgi:hypothetical protein